MSITTELTRLTNAKSAIKAAIEGKGVTVPDGTTLDGMAALVEAISAGANDIIVGSFTPTEGLTTSSPLYIDITFPKNEFPLMYCVFEDTRNLDYNDNSHNGTRIINVISVLLKETFSTKRYMAISVYMNSGSAKCNLAEGVATHADNGYVTSGGVYGSMGISLNDNQIRFKTAENGQWYLAGRTYYYILYWG